MPVYHQSVSLNCESAGRCFQQGKGSRSLLQALRKLREPSLTALLSCAGAPSPGAQYSRRLSGCPSCPTPASTPTSSSSSTPTTGRRPTSPTTAASTERTEMKGEWGVENAITASPLSVVCTIVVMVRSSLVGASTRWINNVNHWNSMQWFILLFMAFWFDKNRMKNNHSNTVQIILNNFNETELVLKACSPWNASCLMFHVSDVEHDDCLCLRKTKSMEDFVTGRYLELDNYGCCISICI